MNIVIHSQASTAQTLNYGIGSSIPPRTLLGIWLLIPGGIEVNTCWQWVPQESLVVVVVVVFIGTFYRLTYDQSVSFFVSNWTFIPLRHQMTARRIKLVRRELCSDIACITFSGVYAVAAPDIYFRHTHTHTHTRPPILCSTIMTFFRWDLSTDLP